jgi:hypothetical protein
MNQSYHRFTELFLQLGLPSDVDGLKHFLENHSPSSRLENAPFWTQAQSTLLRDEILQDADWAEVIDQLNAALRRGKQ